jgi:uncharacterized protein (DUF4415 family)
MALAGEIFAGPALTVPSDREGENRFFTIGLLNGRMVVWTPRDGGRRIISMRKAHESAQKLYRPRLGRPDDAPDLSTPEWAAKLAVTPVRRGRPQAAKRKVSTTIRLDADIVAAFRTGRGAANPPQRRVTRLARPSLSRAIRAPSGAAIEPPRYPPDELSWV